MSNKLFEWGLIKSVSDYFRKFDWENWKWLKQYYSWEEAFISDFLRIEDAYFIIKKSIMNKYE
jgi:hypothetical protein